MERINNRYKRDMIDINKRGGARKGSGRKKGIGITNDIQRHCYKMIEEMLINDAIKLKATKQLALSFEDIKDNYLYIIENSGKHKIGYSSNWNKRKKMYEVHTPEFNLIYLVKNKDAFEFERYLHLIFKDKTIQGEWFNLTQEDLIKAISYCSKRI